MVNMLQDSLWCCLSNLVKPIIRHTDRLNPVYRDENNIQTILKRDWIFLLLLLFLFLYYCIKFVNQKYFGLEGSLLLHYIVGLREGWARGEIYPLWFDNIFLGAPLWQHGFVVPFILPASFSFLNPIVSLKLFNVIFFLFSAYTMYLYVYHHIKNKSISALSGLIYIFIPQRLWQTFAWGNYNPQLHYFLMPLLLLSMERIIHDKKYYFYAVVIFTLILSTFNNFFYIMVLFMAVTIIYYFYSELSIIQKRKLLIIALFFLFSMSNMFSPDSMNYAAFVWLLLLGFFYLYRFIKRDAKLKFIKPLSILLWGLGLTSIFWVPLVFLGPYEQYAGFTVTEQLFRQMPWRDMSLLKYLALMVENSSITNIVIAVLAYFVIFTRGWKNSSIKFYFAILVISIFLNLKIRILWEFLDKYIPYFYNMRYPERFITFFGIIFYPLMIAYSLEKIFSFLKSLPDKFAYKLLKYPITRIFKISCIVFIAVLFAYIFYINQKLNFSEPIAFSRIQPKIPLKLLNGKDERIAIFRANIDVWTFNIDEWEQAKLSNARGERVPSFGSNREVWDINNWTHDAMWSPFVYTNGRKSLSGDDQNYVYRDYDLYFTSDALSKIKVMSMMNTKYIMTILKVPDKDSHDLTLLAMPSEDSDFFVYENKKCMPRVFLTKGSTVDMLTVLATNFKHIPFERVSFVGSLKETTKQQTEKKKLFFLKRHHEKEIVRSVFIPESALIKYPLEKIKYNTIPPINGAIKVVNEEANHIELEVNTFEDAILVYAKANWPGWEAKIDGIKKDVFNANGLMVGLFVPSGSHHIEIKYKFPDFYVLGAKITFIVLLLFLLIWSKDLWYKWFCRTK